MTTLAGTPGVLGSADGFGASARFALPDAVAVDSAGNVYVADTDNHTIRKVPVDSAGNVYVADTDNHTVRKVTSAGVVTTVAGTAGVAGNADGTGAAARFSFPEGVAVDSAGNVYVADFGNSTIRKVTPTGTTSIAGMAGVASALEPGRRRSSAGADLIDVHGSSPRGPHRPGPRARRSPPRCRRHRPPPPCSWSLSLSAEVRSRPEQSRQNPT